LPVYRINDRNVRIALPCAVQPSQASLPPRMAVPGDVAWPAELAALVHACRWMAWPPCISGIMQGLCGLCPVAMQERGTAASCGLAGARPTLRGGGERGELRAL
jgi:hypothetical protein